MTTKSNQTVSAPGDDCAGEQELTLTRRTFVKTSAL